ncbi:DUF6118 family protein [Sphingopyxis sp.]|uniref:DUF6118 family protein n=1 Tax=Sphingopyxis sp. TaxID=1908224 RepID=UPI002ED90986
MHRIIGNARTREQQREYLWWGIGGGVLAGCLLWAILPGVVARIMPTSWHLPERIAARTVREPTLWEAGARIMRANSPQDWKAIVDATEMWRQNREAIDVCEKRAVKAKKSVQCTVKVGR